MTECIVGYTGGKTLHPTYQSIQDHTEALRIEFDPTVVSYETLLAAWTRMHSPTNTKSTCQYRASVWYLNEPQRQAAQTHLAALAERIGKPVTSTVEPATKFYRAEEYHQNFIQNQRW